MLVALQEQTTRARRTFWQCSEASAWGSTIPRFWPAHRPCARKFCQFTRCSSSTAIEASRSRRLDEVFSAACSSSSFHSASRGHPMLALLQYSATYAIVVLWNTCGRTLRAGSAITASVQVPGGIQMRQGSGVVGLHTLMSLWSASKGARAMGCGVPDVSCMGVDTLLAPPRFTLALRRADLQGTSALPFNDVPDLSGYLFYATQLVTLNGVGNWLVCGHWTGATVPALSSAVPELCPVGGTRDSSLERLQLRLLQV